MYNQELPKIEFPCKNYSIKVIGDAHDEFKSLVLSIIHRHAPDFDESTVTDQYSSNGKYHSLRMKITAKDIDQLKAIHDDLKATGRVHMVL